jgi:hypothetical protein
MAIVDEQATVGWGEHSDAQPTYYQPCCRSNGLSPDRESPSHA